MQTTYNIPSINRPCGNYVLIRLLPSESETLLILPEGATPSFAKWEVLGIGEDVVKSGRCAKGDVVMIRPDANLLSFGRLDIDPHLVNAEAVLAIWN